MSACCSCWRSRLSWVSSPTGSSEAEGPEAPADVATRRALVTRLEAERQGPDDGSRRGPESRVVGAGLRGSRRGRSSIGRAPRLQRGGCRFDPGRLQSNGNGGET